MKQVLMEFTPGYMLNSVQPKAQICFTRGNAMG